MYRPPMVLSGDLHPDIVHKISDLDTSIRERFPCAFDPVSGIEDDFHQISAGDRPPAGFFNTLSTRLGAPSPVLFNPYERRGFPLIRLNIRMLDRISYEFTAERLKSLETEGFLVSSDREPWEALVIDAVMRERFLQVRLTAIPYGLAQGSFRSVAEVVVAHFDPHTYRSMGGNARSLDSWLEFLKSHKEDVRDFLTREISEYAGVEFLRTGTLSVAEGQAGLAFFTSDQPSPLIRDIGQLMAAVTDSPEQNKRFLEWFTRQIESAGLPAESGPVSRRFAHRSMPREVLLALPWRGSAPVDGICLDTAGICAVPAAI